MADTVLQGVGVLVTRPEHQADNLCQLLESHSARCIRFPALAIGAPTDNSSLNHIIQHLDDYDLAIFISPNAVEKAITAITNLRELPETLHLAAVGRASAKALDKAGYAPDIFPKTRFNSEALLEMPQLQNVAGKRIVIFRGEGGRELLAETLKQRGAEVDYADCYRRVKPDTSTSKLMKHWARGEISIITVTSNEGLRNLFDLVGQLGRKWLLDTPLVVISERGSEEAQSLGFRNRIIVANNASDEDITQAVIQWKHETEAGSTMLS